LRLKGKFYKAVVRPFMLYRSEGWAVDNKTEQQVNVAENRMLRWMREDSIRNKCISGSVGVVLIFDKMRENRLRWLGHVKRRADS